MKRSKPVPPAGAPEGTVWFGGPIEWFSISITFRGDGLSPDAVTAAFGLEPSRSVEKGAQRLGPDAAVIRVESQGVWSRSLKRAATDEWDIDAAIRAFLLDFPEDDGAWASIPLGADARLFVGLELTSANKGLSLEPDILAWLGRRGVRLDLDIYGTDRVASD